MPENSLPQSATPQIAWLLAELLHHHEGIRLEDEPPAYERLELYAEKVRTWLETQQQAVIMLEESLPQHPLHTVIHRATIEALIDLREPAPVFSSPNPPDRCPSCSKLLNGYWECSFCGLELENAYRHSLIRHASAQPIQHLPLFYLLLPDPARMRVVIVNGHTPRRAVWEVGGPELHPAGAVMHREHSLLVADPATNTVGEYGLCGDVHWRFDSREGKRRLERPVAITAYTPQSTEQELYLIVDQGQHRVLAVNRASEIIWEYGVMGEAGSEPGWLNAPSSAQYTHDETVLIADTGNARVIEIRPHRGNMICWSSEPELGLVRPMHAQRLLSGNTLIVDPGTHRILELDGGGVPVEECIYYQEGYDSRLRMQDPHQVIRLPNKHVVLADAEQVMEIDLPSRELVWNASLAELHAPSSAGLEQTLHPDEGRLRSLRMELAMQQGHFDLETSLRRVKMFEGAPADFYTQLKQYLIEQHVSAGELIVREGESADSLFVLASGRVEVRRQGDVLARLRTGEIFGEMALVLQQARTADIVAREDCNVLRLSRPDFETLLETYPIIRERIRKLAQMRTGIHQMDAFAFGPERLANVKALLEKQYQRVADIKHKLDSSRHTSLLGPRRQPDWRLLYNRIERHIIHEAKLQHHLSYEIHIDLNVDASGNPTSAAALATRLEGLGTLIKIWPLPEVLMEGRFEHQLVMTLISRSTREQLLDELHAQPEVARVAVHGIWF